MKPILLINFKTYKSATGKKAVRLARICRAVAKKTGCKIIVAPQIADIAAVSKIITTISQHVDHMEAGRATGFTLPETIKANSLINHAEHKISMKDLRKTIKRCKKLKLKTFVCAANLNEANKIKQFKPDYIAYEVPELIGTGKSISTFAPKSVERFVKLLKRTKIIPLCGAGISTGNDTKASLKLGCKGMLAASAVTKAKNPKKVLLDLGNLG